MLPNLSVFGVLDKLRESLPPFEVAVIRSIDSSHSPEGVSQILRFHKVDYRTVKDNICVTKDGLHVAVSAGVFTGFDEVWFVEDEPPLDLASVTPATSDTTNFSVEVPSDIMNEAKAVHCCLLLADGCGLNYLSNDKQISDTINAMSNE